MRGAKVFVFLQTVNPERAFLGSAEFVTTLGALVQRYPHLEATFAGSRAHTRFFLLRAELWMGANRIGGTGFR
jgi:hypothetical protein